MVEPTPTITGDTAEAVAYALMLRILRMQGKFDGDNFAAGSNTETELLELYSRCIKAVRSSEG